MAQQSRPGPEDQWSKAQVKEALLDLERWCEGTPLNEEYMIRAVRMVVSLAREAIKGK